MYNEITEIENNYNKLTETKEIAQFAKENLPKLIKKVKDLEGNKIELLNSLKVAMKKYVPENQVDVFWENLIKEVLKKHNYNT